MPINNKNKEGESSFKFQTSIDIVPDELKKLIEKAVERETGHKVESITFKVGSVYDMPGSSGVQALTGVHVKLGAKKQSDSSSYDFNGR